MKDDTCINKIKYAYWHLWPYDWRPGQIWYHLKCWAWLRYTTVKPRYLGHTWCDRSTILPNAMFEVLCQFVERECSPGYVEWYGECGHKITVGGEEKYVMDEMKDLIAWWHQVWNKDVGEVEDMLWAEAHKHTPTSYFEPFEDSKDLMEWKLRFTSEGDEEIYRCCLDGLRKLEQNMEAALEKRLHRIIKLIPYMWT